MYAKLGGELSGSEEYLELTALSNIEIWRCEGGVPERWYNRIDQQEIRKKLKKNLWSNHW